jgi:hypothetical protein
MRSKIVLSLVLSLSLTFGVVGCAKKPATSANLPAATLSKGDQIIHDAKVYGPVVLATIEEAVKQEAQFAASGVIPPAIEPGIRQGLLDARKVVSAFNDKAATWTHFDASNRDDIKKLIDDALAFVERIYNEGVLRITNPQSQQIASGILSGAKVTLVLWKSSFQEAQQ